jgi:hypothetical protein
MEKNIENTTWTNYDEEMLNNKLKHLIKVLELKKNKISLEEYLKFIAETKTEFERKMYMKRLTELLEMDEL